MHRVIILVPRCAATPERAVARLADVERSCERRGLRVVAKHADSDVVVAVVAPATSVLDPSTYLIHRDDQSVVAATGELYREDSALTAFSDPDWSTPLRAQGHFAAVRCDSASGEVEIVTDRYGLLPVYHAELADVAVYSQDFGAVVDLRPSGIDLDRAAAAQLISMEMILDNRTLVEGIRRLPHASWIRRRHDDVRLERYWDYPFGTVAETDESDEILMDRIDDALRRAMHVEFERADGRPLVPLSGGMDSRTILAHLAEMSERPLETFTVHPRRASNERRYAERAAGAVGASWTGRVLDDSVDPGSELPTFVADTGCSSSGYQSWSISAYRALGARGSRRAVHGLAFDAQLHANPRFLAGGGDFEETVDRIHGTYRAGGPSLFADVFSEAFSTLLEREPRRALEVALAPLRDAEPRHLSDYALWVGRVRTYTAAEINANRRHVTWGLPYLHPEVFDVVVTIPHARRADYRLYAKWFRRRFPALADLPSGNTGAAVGRPESRSHRLARRLERLEYYVLRASGGRLERPASFPGFFRRDPRYRRSLLSLLERERAIECGLITRAGVRRLVERIDSGHSYYFPLLVRLATVETVVDRFLARTRNDR